MRTSHATAFFLTLALATVCDRPKEKPKLARSIELVPHLPVSVGIDSAAAAADALETARRLRCLPLWPIHLTFEGTLGTEHHLGPPGYGETPAQDRRDTIVVLRLDKPVAVCGDTDTNHKVVTVSKIQLGGYAGPMTPGIGSRVTVFGTLRAAVFGWHYLPIVMTVDSIPALRAKPRRVSASML